MNLSRKMEMYDNRKDQRKLDHERIWGKPEPKPVVYTVEKRQVVEGNPDSINDLLLQLEDLIKETK